MPAPRRPAAALAARARALLVAVALALGLSGAGAGGRRPTRSEVSRLGLVQLGGGDGARSRRWAAAASSDEGGGGEHAEAEVDGPVDPLGAARARSTTRASRPTASTSRPTTRSLLPRPAPGVEGQGADVVAGGRRPPGEQHGGADHGAGGRGRTATTARSRNAVHQPRSVKLDAVVDGEGQGRAGQPDADHHEGGQLRPAAGRRTPPPRRGRPPGRRARRPRTGSGPGPGGARALSSPGPSPTPRPPPGRCGRSPGPAPPAGGPWPGTTGSVRRRRARPCRTGCTRTRWVARLGR